MKAVKVPVGKSAYVVDLDTSLESLQKEVGGYIELFFPYDDFANIAIVCNEEGKLISLPQNRVVNGALIYGDFLIVNTVDIYSEDGNDFCDLNDEEISLLLNVFS